MKILIYGALLVRRILSNLDLRIEMMKKIAIPNDQLRRIINIDESCLYLDHNKGRRGGRTSVRFFNRGLPHSVRSDSKYSVTTTSITGISASGEALPPRFQFSKKVKERYRERIRTEALLYMKNTRGQFGIDSVQ